MPIHSAAIGECISTIADQYGFFWETVWNHDQNQSLRTQRGNPNVIFPGDKVFIPDKTQKEESGVTGQVHTFRLKGIPCRLVFKLLDVDGEPIAKARYTLEVDGKSEDGVTDAEGMVDHIIPPNAKKATLTVHSPSGEDDDDVYDFDLGQLNPVTDDSGLKARLTNLGFLLDGADSDPDVENAVRGFQKWAGLPETGKPDDALRQRLVEAHGS